MSSGLSVILFAILCFGIGIVLAVFPWLPHGWFGLSDWGNNYFLLLAAHKTGYGLQRFVSSGWVRGAVSGIGVIHIMIAVWELINFPERVRALDAGLPSVESSPNLSPKPAANEARPVQTDPLSDYPRRNR